MDLRLFREPTFTAATIGMICFYSGFSIMLLGGSLFLTLAQSWNPGVAGLAFSVGPGAAVIASLAAAPLHPTIASSGLSWQPPDSSPPPPRH